MRAEVRRAVAWRSGAQLLVQLVAWGSTIVVIRLLAPADYGLMAMAQIVVGLLTLFGAQGLASAVVAAPVLSPGDERRAAGAALLLGLGLAAAQALAAYAAARLFGEPRVAPILWALAAAYPFATWGAVAAAVRQRSLDFRTVALSEAAASLANAVATLSAALSGQGVWALVAGQIAAAVARWAWLAASGGGLPRPTFALAEAAPLWRFGGVLTVNGLLFYALAQAPTLVGGRLLGAPELGLYSTAFFLASLPAARFLPMLSEVGLAAYARARDDPAAVARGFRLTTRVVALTTFPLFLGLAATAPDAAPVLLGPQWRAAAPHFAAVALAMPAYTLFMLFGAPSAALGVLRQRTWAMALAAAAMPLLCWALVVRVGGLGLALAWLILMPPLLVAGNRETIARLQVSARAFLTDFGRPLAAALVMGAGVALARTALPLDPAPRLGLSVGLGIALYAPLAAWWARDAVRDLFGLLRR